LLARKFENRQVGYATLVRVWLALKAKSEPRYHYSDAAGKFIPSGVWVYKGTQRAIIEELGLNPRYWHDAFRELAAVGCIRALRPWVWQIIRPPLRSDWLSLRSDQTKYVHYLRVMRAYVPITKPPVDPTYAPKMHSLSARRQLRDASGRFLPEGKTRRPSRPL
jgi:hypothetical protein